MRPAPQHFCGAKGPKINGYVLDNSRYKFYVSYVDPHKNNAISCIILCCGGGHCPSGHYSCFLSIPMHNHKFCGHFVSETHALFLFVLLHQPLPATTSCNQKTREPSIRLIDRTNQTTPKLIQSTMPTHQQITAARERGAEADALTEDLLLAIQHHHHQQ